METPVHHIAQDHEESLSIHQGLLLWSARQASGTLPEQQDPCEVHSSLPAVNRIHTFLCRQPAVSVPEFEIGSIYTVTTSMANFESPNIN